MSAHPETDLTEYACDSCNKRFRLPRPRTRLGLRAKLTVLGMALARTVRHRHGLRSGYREIRPRLLARRNDDAFQAFVGSFGLCRQCRGFVCSKCWNEKTRTCRACATPAERRPSVPQLAHQAPVVARVVAAKAVPKAAPEAWSRPTFGLGLLMRPSRVRTATSVVLMVAALTLGAAEAAYVIAAPNSGPVAHAPAAAAPAATLAP